MKSFAVLALAATALAQSPPPGCQANSGSFNIQTVNVTRSATSKRGIETRQLSGTLTLTLKDGILRDQAGRQGYIASNYQFQFDAPLQTGARESTGFSVCGNGSLALSASGRAAPAIWYQCLSGTFYNLYSQSTGAQCIPIYITAVNQGGSGASQISDGQPQVTSASGPRVSQISDGQPQASSPRPAPSAVVSQISDGQPQASAPRPASTRPVVSQISDGQPQASAPLPAVTAPVVSQISDGQPQASAPLPAVTAPVVSQISDGQPQASAPRPASTRPVVSQISDGQPQASAPLPAVTAPVVSQISDGQPQASAPLPASTRPVVSQISDGQPQVGTPRPNNGTVATPTAPTQFTGAAATGNAAAGALAAGIFGLFAML